MKTFDSLHRTDVKLLSQIKENSVDNSDFLSS